VTADWRISAAGCHVPQAAQQVWQSSADVVIWLLPQPPVWEGGAGAGLPVWLLMLDGLPAAQPLAGARCMLQAPHLCETRLLDYSTAQPLLLYRSMSAAVTNSLTATRRRALNKSKAFMARTLAARLAQRTPTPPVQADQPAALSPATPPGGLTLFTGVALRVLQNRRERSQHLDQWQIAYTFDTAPGWDQLERFHFLAPPKSVFWADPMPLAWQDRHWIMFEELPFAAPRGRLLAIEVRPDGSHGEPLPVMECPYHLSYPFMVKDQGQLYMVPETSATRQVELHRCVEFPGKWELEAVLLKGVNAVDTTIYQHGDGRWWMWVSVVEEGAERGEELHLYHAEQLHGPWLAHPANPVVSDIRCARPAGTIMNQNGVLMRPAQNSADGYGRHIEWRRVIELTPERYAEEPAGVLEPKGNPAWLRMHTAAEADGLRVVDVMVRRSR
jgi:hypothetical protein